MIPDSIITCPECGFRKSERMPTDRCQHFYRCPNCGSVLQPEEGDCCVFCSYGSVPCPPVQMSRGTNGHDPMLLYSP